MNLNIELFKSRLANRLALFELHKSSGYKYIRKEKKGNKTTYYYRDPITGKETTQNPNKQENKKDVPQEKISFLTKIIDFFKGDKEKAKQEYKDSYIEVKDSIAEKEYRNQFKEYFSNKEIVDNYLKNLETEKGLPKENKATKNDTDKSKIKITDDSVKKNNEIKNQIAKMPGLIPGTNLRIDIAKMLFKKYGSGLKEKSTDTNPEQERDSNKSEKGIDENKQEEDYYEKKRIENENRKNNPQFIQRQEREKQRQYYKHYNNKPDSEIIANLENVKNSMGENSPEYKGILKVASEKGLIKNQSQEEPSFIERTINFGNLPKTMSNKDKEKINSISNQIDDIKFKINSLEKKSKPKNLKKSDEIKAWQKNKKIRLETLNKLRIEKLKEGRELKANLISSSNYKPIKQELVADPLNKESLDKLIIKDMNEVNNEKKEFNKQDFKLMIGLGYPENLEKIRSNYTAGFPEQDLRIAAINELIQERDSKKETQSKDNFDTMPERVEKVKEMAKKIKQVQEQARENLSEKKIESESERLENNHSEFSKSFKSIPAKDIKTKTQYTSEDKYDKPIIEGIKQNILANGYDHSKPITIDSDGFVVDGHHRFTAIQDLIREGKISKDTPIPTITKTYKDESERLMDQVSANKMRRQVNILDDSKAYSELIEKGKTVQEISDRTGENQDKIRNTIALNSLIPELQSLLTSDHMSDKKRKDSTGDGTKIKQESLSQGIAISIARNGLNEDGTPNGTIQRKAFAYSQANKGVTPSQIASYINTLKSQNFSFGGGIDSSGRSATQQEALKNVGDEGKAHAQASSAERFIKESQVALSKLFGTSVGEIDPKLMKELTNSIVGAKGEGKAENLHDHIDALVKTLVHAREMIKENLGNIKANASMDDMFAMKSTLWQKHMMYLINKKIQESKLYK